MASSASRVGLLGDVSEALDRYGLNVIGATSVVAYEALVPARYYVASLLPEAQTVVVIGNGGGAFWAGFRQYCDTRPQFFSERAHPLDDYTTTVIENTLVPILDAAGAIYRLVYPFRFTTESVSFMHLAQAAGLASPSILGVMIHPIYGPWLGLRVAVLIDRKLTAAQPAAGFNPCPSCAERPCMSVCPAGAVSVETGWDIPSCVRHRLQVASDCVDRCHARYQCVYGREHRYPANELWYHQRRSFAEMRKYFEE
jgi:epoxyqueuosine reductase